MYRFVLLAAITLCFSCKSQVLNLKNIETFDFPSKNTKDTYKISIRKPDNFSTKKSYSVLYATDGSLGLGEYLSGINEKWAAVLPTDLIVVLIGHHGDWHEKRQRDFIPSDISNDSSLLFGHADQFYTFLKTELIPVINTKLPNQSRKYLLGHSFGGLFCLYAALKNDTLFNHYYAISPSVWANYSELLKIENRFAENSKNLNSSIDIYAGSLEVFNKVLSSSKEFYDSLQSRKYPNLILNFTTINNANHFSVRKPAVDKILNSIASK